MCNGRFTVPLSGLSESLEPSPHRPKGAQIRLIDIDYTFWLYKTIHLKTSKIIGSRNRKAVNSGGPWFATDSSPKIYSSTRWISQFTAHWHLVLETPSKQGIDFVHITCRWCSNSEWHSRQVCKEHERLRYSGGFSKILPPRSGEWVSAAWTTTSTSLAGCILSNLPSADAEYDVGWPHCRKDACGQPSSPWPRRCWPKFHPCADAKLFHCQRSSRSLPTAPCPEAADQGRSKHLGGSSGTSPTRLSAILGQKASTAGTAAAPSKWLAEDDVSPNEAKAE